MDPLSRPALLALRELADQGTMAAAADVLGVTTGAVSQQISAMESRLGVALVERVGRRVRLTDPGRLVLEHAGRILAAQDAAMTALEGVRDHVSGAVVIGVFGSAASLLPAITSSVAAANPDIRIRSREVDVDGAVAAVRRGEVDLAFGLDYDDLPAALDDEVTLRPIRTERFALATSAADDRFGTTHRPGRGPGERLDPPAGRHAVRTDHPARLSSGRVRAGRGLRGDGHRGVAGPGRGRGRHHAGHPADAGPGTGRPPANDRAGR